jgi:hypothetical protein
MRPIAFTCGETVPLAASEVCMAIVQVERWPEFEGYGLVPGIAQAHYELRTESMVGSRVRVRNTDGSTHTEEIIVWHPDDRVTIRMSDFSRPLTWFADHFIEDWRLSPQDRSTLVARTFHLHPKNAIGRGVLWFASLFLRKAVARHLRRLRSEAILVRTDAAPEIGPGR